MKSILCMVPSVAESDLSQAAGLAGVGVKFVESAAALLAELRSGQWEATLVSLGHDHADEAVVRRIVGQPSSGTVLLSTRSPSFGNAMLAERVGAAALVVEPVAAEVLEQHLARADRSKLLPLERSDPDAGIVGASAPMLDVFSAVARAAGSSSTVLLAGESGTGKEVVARTIHHSGTRADGPFVSVNCAAIPEQLLESELFGHERGAFTGATGRRIGRFERAHGGTLFLDEIGDMSPVLQAKVLRVLEEREVEPLGGAESRSVDVRVIAATHRDLRRRIESGAFREDLYYRLAVLEVVLPPLRERSGDVERLAMHFLGHFAEMHDRQISGISAAAMSELRSAEWPGNVRELRNVIDRAVLLARDGVVRKDSLQMGEAVPRWGPVEGEVRGGYPHDYSLTQVEAAHIRGVLEQSGGHIGRAAEVLGIHRNTLARKVQEYQIEPSGRATG